MMAIKNDITHWPMRPGNSMAEANEAAPKDKTIPATITMQIMCAARKTIGQSRLTAKLRLGSFVRSPFQTVHCLWCISRRLPSYLISDLLWRFCIYRLLIRCIGSMWSIVGLWPSAEPRKGRRDVVCLRETGRCTQLR